MGIVFTAECDCGFRKEGLYTGYGYCSCGNVDLQPAACLNCGVVSLMDALKGPADCPRCGAEMVFYHEPSMHMEMEGIGDREFRYAEYLPEEVRYRCPECMEMDLKFRVDGFWE